MKEVSSPENIKKRHLPVSFLICFNIVFAGCGGATIALGIIILRDVGRILLFRLISPDSPIMSQVGLCLMGIGAFGIFTSILGCSSATRKCHIGWYIFCVLVTLMSEIGLGISFLFFHDAFGKGLVSSTIQSKIQASYGIDQPFTQSMDFAQYKFNCCGSENELDYEGSKWKKRKLGGSHLLVPWTCCPINESISHSPSYMNPVPMNATACQSTQPFNSSHRFKEGCHQPIESWFQKETLTFLLMGLILFLLQVSTLTAAICLCRKIK